MAGRPKGTDAAPSPLTCVADLFPSTMMWARLGLMVNTSFSSSTSCELESDLPPHKLHFHKVGSFPERRRIPFGLTPHEQRRYHAGYIARPSSYGAHRTRKVLWGIETSDLIPATCSDTCRPRTGARPRSSTSENSGQKDARVNKGKKIKLLAFQRLYFMLWDASIDTAKLIQDLTEAEIPYLPKMLLEGVSTPPGLEVEGLANEEVTLASASG